MSPFFLYLILRLDTVLSVLGPLTFISGIAAFFLWAMYYILNGMIRSYRKELMDSEQAEKTDEEVMHDKGSEDDFALYISVRKAKTPVTILFFIFVSLIILLPTTKEAAAIYVVPKIVNNETIKTDAGNLYSLAIEALKGALIVKVKETEEEAHLIEGKEIE